MTQSTTEKCARALAEADVRSKVPALWDDAVRRHVDANWRDYIPQVRTVFQNAREPTEAMWGGLARQIVFWQRGGPGQTGASLYRFLEPVGFEAPEWLRKEIPDDNRVPPKGTIAAVIWQAMLDEIMKEEP